jgi:hypothetical protein
VKKSIQVRKINKSYTGIQNISKYISRLVRHEIMFTLTLLIIVLSVLFYELRLLNSQLLINSIVNNDIDYEEFRKLLISEEAINRVKSEVNHIVKTKPEYEGILYMDPVGYLTLSMMAGKYDLINNNPVDGATFIRALAQVVSVNSFRELYLYYSEVLSDAVFFPVPRMKEADIHYSDSWNYKRTYGGLRKHEGTDLMASNNLSGYFPVISITEGIVEKLGWLEQGGYRIGIRSNAGGYFYYAHLYKYAPEIAIGDKIIAGQLLGFMGDSGYGPEGTTGKFDVHLHLGVYVDSDALGTGEMSVNPYYLLRLIEKNRTYLLPVSKE